MPAPGSTSGPQLECPRAQRPGPAPRPSPSRVRCQCIGRGQALLLPASRAPCTQPPPACDLNPPHETRGTCRPAAQGCRARHRATPRWSRWRARGAAQRCSDSPQGRAGTLRRPCTGRARCTWRHPAIPTRQTPAGHARRAPSRLRATGLPGPSLARCPLSDRSTGRTGQAHRILRAVRISSKKVGSAALRSARPSTLCVRDAASRAQQRGRDQPGGACSPAQCGSIHTRGQSDLRGGAAQRAQPRT